MTNLFRGTYFEAMNMRNLLENKDIQVFTENENMANLEPWAVSSGGHNVVILKVNDEDFDVSRKLIEDFENGNLDVI
jgi:hypothetical protein